MQTTQTTKPQLSFWQIWNMCFGFLGIQFGFALQNSNVSRIFQTLGASIDDIPILWIAAPLTGLIVQPIVGYYSDRTWGKLGRRRPYFLYGALVTTLALLVMPNSPTLWIAAGTLWILDASINVTMEPFRAFVGDNLPSNQRPLGFAMQSFFIGVGAVVASMLPWLMSNVFAISNTAAPGIVPDAVMYSFYIGALVLLAAVLWTVFRSHEYSPKQLAEFARYEQTEPIAKDKANENRYWRSGAVYLALGLIAIAIVSGNGLNKELYIFGGGLAVFGALQWFVSLQKNKQQQSMLQHIVDDLFTMPSTMKQLAVVQFFSWFSLFAMWIYTTAAVTQHHFGSSDPTSAAYNNGADWVGVLFAAYNGFAALAAFVIPWLARKTSAQFTHALCLFSGALGLSGFYLINDPQWLLLPMVGIGIAWAGILSLPYALLADSLPSAKMGVYMGIFNFFIVIPQVLAASILGSLVHYFFAGDAIFALLLGAASFVIAGGYVLTVRPHQSQQEEPL